MRTLPRIVLASALMGIALFAMTPWLQPWLTGRTTFVMRFAALVGGGLVVYAICAVLFRAVEIRQFRRFLKRG